MYAVGGGGRQIVDPPNLAATGHRNMPLKCVGKNTDRRNRFREMVVNLRNAVRDFKAESPARHTLDNRKGGPKPATASSLIRAHQGAVLKFFVVFPTGQNW